MPTNPVDPLQKILHDAVADQYTRHPYPDPSLGLLQRRDWADPATFHDLYWPTRAPWEGQRLLVAGCGTVEAALIARNNPTATVLGIDVSAASLAHTAQLAHALGLTNLQLEQRPIEAIGALGVAFDHISCGGVLHHTEDPLAALTALAGTLAPDGVLSLSVYATYGRTGVTMLEEAFRLLGLGHSDADQSLARSVLAALPAHHPVQGWWGLTGERGALDAHLIDTFLHPRAATFTTRSLAALLTSAGLAFQSWVANVDHYPDAHFPPGHPLLTQTAAWPDADLWALMERLHPTNDLTLVACRADRPAHRYALDFAAARLLDAVPWRAFPEDPRPRMPYDPRNPVEEQLYLGINGERTVREILAPLGPSNEAFGRGFLRHLWRKDNVIFRWEAPEGAEGAG